jgi:hypothetical protein
MAEFWENDPVATSVASGQAADWWKNDPVVETPDVAVDMAKGFGHGANTGIDAMLNVIGSPIRVPINEGARLLGYEGELIPELNLARRANVAPPETRAGRFTEAVGEVAGGSVLPFGAMNVASKLPGAATNRLLNSIAQRPGQAAAIETASTTGAGGGVGIARDQEWGPVAEVGLGLIGGFAAPNALNMAGRFVSGTRDAARYGNRMVERVRNPEQAAIEEVADRLAGAGADPSAMRNQVLGNIGNRLQNRGFTREQIADIISRQLQGETADVVARSHGIAPSTARSYFNLYQDQNPTPMNVIDMTKEIAGEGASSPVTRLGRAAYSLSGDASGDAAQALVSRQELQPGRVSGIARRSVGGQDFETTRTAGLQNLSDEADQNYQAFYRQPDLAIDQLSDLMQDPLFRRANVMAQRQARVEAIRRNQTAARNGGPQEAIPEADPDNQVFSPEMLDLIQRQLRITSEGFANNPNAARHAQNLRQVFLDRIENHYPEFRQIRRSYAEGMGEFGADGALNAGRELTARLGERADDALRDFNQMTPAQQELFRLGFARKIMDDAANKVEGTAVANRYGTGAFREIVRRIFSGDNDLSARGERLIRDLRREATTTKTKNDVLAGARTAELEGDMGRIQEGVKTAADLATGRFGKLLEHLSNKLETQLGREGATEVMRVLTETDPAQLLPILNRLARAATTRAERQAYATAIRQYRRAGARPASQVGTVAAAGEDQAER